MKIEEIIFNCWPGKTIKDLSPKSIEEKMVDYWSCLEHNLSSLSVDDQISVIRVYLLLLGFNDLKVVDSKSIILSINYLLPASISINGSATIASTFENYKGTEFEKSDFVFVFTFDKHNNELTSTPRLVRVDLSDCTKILGQILAIRFYREYSSLGQHDETTDISYLFGFLENRWGITIDQLKATEMRWNSFSSEKIELKSRL